MNNTRLRFLLFLALCCGPATGRAQQGLVTLPTRATAAPDRPVEIEVVTAGRVFVPGDSMVIGLRFKPNPGWHTYWHHAGDVGSAPAVEWSLPDGYEITPLRWPAPSLISSPPLASYGYEREVFLPGTMHIPRSARPGSSVTLKARVSWVVCRVECLAGDADVAVTRAVGETQSVDTAVQRILAIEEARVPVKRVDWRIDAISDSTTITLRVRGVSSAAFDSTSYFFVDSVAVIDHAAPQQAVRMSDGVDIMLKRSPYATSIPQRLSGVLVARDADPAVVAVEIDAPVVAGDRNRPGIGAGAFGTAGFSALLWAALFAIVGGTLLNVMPCVLPVLSIKAFGLAEAASHDAAAARRHALLFSMGVLLSMWALVIGLLLLRAAGTEVGWGYQLQTPAVVGSLALLVFAAALNMAGVFQLLPVGGAMASRTRALPPAADALLSGVLVTALATPCSAPFLGAAVAYGIAAGPVHALIVFTGLAVGLVWPLMTVALVPSARRHLPKPGPWMVTLRQLLSFPLFATVVWLVWVFGRQTSVDHGALLLAALLLVGAASWTYGRFASLDRSPGVRKASAVFVIAIAAVAVWLVFVPQPSAHVVSGVASPMTDRPAGTLPWEPYSEEALRLHRANGRVVLVDFDADWCLTCKVNERVAFGSDTVRAMLRIHDVVLLRADWTRRDSIITRAIHALGRNSIPLVVVYSPGSDTPEYLPTLLLPGTLNEAIASAARRVATQ